MSGVLIVAGEADADFAGEVRKATRGLDIEIARSLPAGEQRTVLLVWSAAQPATAADVPTLIDLWSRGRLVIARRDDTPLPLGLGDLETVPAGAPARETAFKLLHATLAPGDAATNPSGTRETAPMAAPPPLPSRARKSRAAVWIGATAVVLLLAAGAGTFLGNRADAPRSAAAPVPPVAQAMPKSTVEVREPPTVSSRSAMPYDPGVVEMERREREAVPAGEMSTVVWMVAGAVALAAVGLIGFLLGRRRTSPPPIHVAAAAQPVAASAGELLFVSYAHHDRPRVDPLVLEIEGLGRAVWIDRTGMTGGPGWAGQIARAIKGSRAVVLMASPSAYASDQVVRELYLAMGSRKTIVPIELEPADLPDELAYILAPFQRHALVGDPRTMLMRALDKV